MMVEVVVDDVMVLTLTRPSTQTVPQKSTHDGAYVCCVHG